MIRSISITTPTGRHDCLFEIKAHKAVIDSPALPVNGSGPFDIEIVFDEKIVGFRNHDHTWAGCNKDCTATEFSPKIVKLANGNFVQANLAIGIWQVKKKNPKMLLWRFNPENAAPITAYTGGKNEKRIVQANRKYAFAQHPALLFSVSAAIEFSRSEIPFSAIACFTDHCDFDTPQSLQLQREFFRSHDIKVTKGFFLNHYSKRADNASFENDSAELIQWKNDGHELAYHSLSQSIKPDGESFSDFNNFTPPFPDLPTWIDHGYQPYNFTLFQNSKANETDYEQTIRSKNITTFWNYIDTGTAASGVINQLNPGDFTLRRFRKGNKNLQFSRRMGLMIKNIVFHYYADEGIILKYKSTASNFKELVYKKRLNRFFSLVRNFFGLAVPILKVFIFWNKHKDTPYKLAEFTPVIFRHTIDNVEFHIFQTVEMVDFQKSLSHENIDRLIHENGLFIAHTYFSVPMAYHTGRMFTNPGTIAAGIAENFSYLSAKIKKREIWNPTLNALMLQLSKFEEVLLDVDAQGNIIILKNPGLHHRTVN